MFHLHPCGLAHSCHNNTKKTKKQQHWIVLSAPEGAEEGGRREAGLEGAY